MEIIDFMPKYPNINNYSDDIFNPYLEDFNLSIFKKKEFYDEKLPKIEKFPEKPGDQFKHQKIIARFLSSRTMYDQLLLTHFLGSGKTCTAIGAIEQIRSEKSSITGAIIFAKGETLLRNFINELVNKCTSGYYKDPTSVRINNKKVREYYNFETYETFAKYIKSISNKTIEEKFSNKILVLDEVHNLRLKKKKEEDLNIYEEFWRLCHYTKNTKILLLSATPMTDTPFEIANILNLILPIGEQLPTGKDFMSVYFEPKSEDGLYNIKNTMKEKLKLKIKGRVSYLNVMSSDVKMSYEQNGETDKLKYFIVYKDFMSKFQDKFYSMAYNKDTTNIDSDIIEGIVDEKSGLYKNSRQASLFIFPDGSYGSTGFNKYINIGSKSLIFEEGKNKVIYNYTLKPELLEKLNGKTDEEKLLKLEKYSSKYADTIRNILKCRDEGKCVFVYSELVKGSGLILFSKILQLYGFSESNGVEKDEKPRYSIITNETTSQSETANIIKKFNLPENMRGKYINVILGSKVISEGITLKNIQSENILTTWWNYTQISQAIGRGYRLGSHLDLIRAGITPEVKVYQRVSIPRSEIPSIDLRMYIISEIKDINIKQIERLIKESSFDCGLNYNRNYIKGRDGERDCDYMECNYKCDGVPKKYIENNISDLDYSTYELYYESENIMEITKQIKDLYKLNFSIDLSTLLRHFNNYKYFEVISALRNMINNNDIINNKYGFPTYLKEDHNVFFLTNILSIETNYLSDYYIENPIILDNEKYENIINNMYLEKIPLQINQIFKSENLDKITDILIKLPLDIQEIILEYTLIAENKNIEYNQTIRKKILDFFKEYYYNFDGILVSDLLYEDNDIIRCLKPDSTLWEECSDTKYIKLIEELKMSKKKMFEKSSYGYYGQLNKKNNQFCIRDISKIDEEEKEEDKRLLSSGKRCVNWDKKLLANILGCKLKVPIPTSDTKSLKKFEKIILGKTKRELWDMIHENQYTKDCLVNNEYNYTNNTEDDLKRIIYWGSIMIKSMCSNLMEWFKNNNLLDEKDLTCGIKTKKKE